MNKSSKNNAKVLLIDIETSPNTAATWGLWNQNISLDMLQADWTILSFAAKWLGEGEGVLYRSVEEQGVGNYDEDLPLLIELWHLLDEADFVIGHNAKRFDVKKINARLIMNGFDVPSPYRIIDTLTMAKKTFAFTSNKLAHLTDKLCVTKKRDHSKFAGYKLWKECLAGNQEAWDEMRLYNIDDVLSLEELYFRLAPWCPSHPVLSLFNENKKDDPVCPRCGSVHLQRRGYTYTNAGKYQRFRCGDCSGWSQARKNSLSTAELSTKLKSI